MLALIRAEPLDALFSPLPEFDQQMADVKAVLRKYVAEEEVANIFSTEPSMLFMDTTQLDVTYKRCFGRQLATGVGAGVSYLAINCDRICRIYRVIKRKKRWQGMAQCNR